MLKSVKVKNFLFIAAAVFILFAYSRRSWGNFISSNIWTMSLVAAMALLMVIIVKVRPITADRTLCLMVLMTGIFLINNHDVSHYGLAPALDIWIYVLLLYAVLSKDTVWVPRIMLLLTTISAFYSIMTFICCINTNFYYNVVYPAVRAFGSSWFISHPSAGITSDYSINGCYMAIGVCTSLPVIIGREDIENKAAKLFYTVCFALCGAGMLMSGKRALLIGVVLAFLVAYFNYTSGKTKNRFFKLLVGFSVVFVFLLILSHFIPTVNYMFERFSGEGYGEAANNERLKYWEYAWKHFQERPIFGHGWRWFRYNNHFRDMPNDVHCTLLQLLLETGIVGTVVFFAFFIRALKRTIQVSRFMVKNKEMFTYTDISGVYFSLIFQVYFMNIIEIGSGFYSDTHLITYFMCCAITEYYYKLLAREEMEGEMETSVSKDSLHSSPVVI